MALRIYKLAFIIIVSCALSACGGSSSTDNESLDSALENMSGPNNNGLITDNDNASDQQLGVAILSPPSENITDQSEADGRVSLINEITPKCPVVGEPFTLSVFEQKTTTDNSEPEQINVTRFATIIQSNSTALEIISRTDDSVSLVMQKQDIASLTSEIENGSVTSFVGAFGPESPASSVLRKPVPGGCYVALRLDNDRYCGTAFGKAATIDLRLIDEGISITACEIDNPAGLSVIEIPPE